MITTVDKALTALVMGALALANIFFGFQFTGLTEEQITGIIAAITPILVYLVPNRQKQP